MEVEEIGEDVPQNEPLSNQQIQNSAGGYSFKVDELKRFLRFLCLGTEGGTYYIGEKELTLENAQCVVRLAESKDAMEALRLLINISVEGRAAKQNPTIFALAYFCRQAQNAELKKAAYNSLEKICRIPTHLFQFVAYTEVISPTCRTSREGNGTGWGRSQRRAVSRWYLNYETNPKHLATHVTKYRSRKGWSHTDVLRLAHPKPKSSGIGAVLKYVIKGLQSSKDEFLKEETDEDLKKIFSYLSGVESARKAKEPSVVVDLIMKHQLVREHVPTSCLRSVDIWSALLPQMPMTAMIRNLGVMSSIGLLDDGRHEVDTVIEKLEDVGALKASKIHPFSVLLALYTYRKGSGDKGKLKWTANNSIIQALDGAFYKCFKHVEPTGKRFLLALDVSGSMNQGVLGSSCIMASEASAAMAMVTARAETQCEIVGFSHTLVPVPISAEMNLDVVVGVMQKIPMGDTDCAQPMIWANENKKNFDVFIVYTDSETWIGKIHPAEALRKYRQASGILNAKLIVVAMCSNKFTIADPEDPGMLDVAGFDSAAPEVLRNFTLELI